MSLSKWLAEFVKSIRGILHDQREADAVLLAKLGFENQLSILESFQMKDSTRQQINLLKIELDAVTTKKDIERLTNKLSKIIEVEYPE